MSILIITESYFGNTSAIAKAVAEGIINALGAGQASIVTASEASASLPAGLTTAIIAAPTHDFSLPTPRTREQARAKGATANTTRGVREWIEIIQPATGLPIVTIDTSTKTRFTPGTASKTAYKNAQEARLHQRPAWPELPRRRSSRTATRPRTAPRPSVGTRLPQLPFERTVGSDPEC